MAAQQWAEKVVVQQWRWRLSNGDGSTLSPSTASALGARGGRRPRAGGDDERAAEVVAGHVAVAREERARRGPVEQLDGEGAVVADLVYDDVDVDDDASGRGRRGRDATVRGLERGRSRRVERTVRAQIVDGRLVLARRQDLVADVELVFAKRLAIQPAGQLGHKLADAGVAEVRRFL